MWTPIELPPPAGRVTGVGVPVRGRMLVFTAAGVYKLWLGPSVVARYALPLDRAAGRLSAAGTLRHQHFVYDCHGECGRGGAVSPCAPRAELPTGERVEVEGGTVRVLDPAGREMQAFDGFAPGAAWTAAAFSQLGAHLVLAEPGRVRVFGRQTRPANLAGRWQASGGVRDHASFLDAIRAAPDDDVPRLVFADWLDENDDPARAELIRVQCELAKHGPDWAAGPAVNPLREREAELIVTNNRRWWAELPVVRGVRWTQGFDRGFPLAWANTALTLVRMAARAREVVPLDSVDIHALEPDHARRLAECPHLGRVRRLRAYYTERLTADDWVAFLTRMAGLRELVIGPYPEHGLRAVAAVGPPGLEWLRFERGWGAGRVTTGTVQALARSVALPNLKAVNGWFREVDAAAVAELAARVRVVSA